MLILEKRASWLSRLLGWSALRIRSHGALKMAELSHTAAGCGMDMLAATEETTCADLRRTFFRHALDEQKHARLFAQRATGLAGTRSRAGAVLDDANYIRSHGIRPVESLYSELGELRFMASVWLAELRSAQQLDVYAELLAGDPEGVRMFQEIAKDERFHIAYSRRELDRFVRDGHGKSVSRALLITRLHRFRDGWLRIMRRIGEVMASFWLLAVYFLILPPFALLARRDRRRPGFVAAAPVGLDPRQLAVEQI
jgi:hypothetical protein